jgi:Rps23 Pro-64 3,4-dihydroxylase Tpa1-like proline 4-hydroxylase
MRSFGQRNCFQIAALSKSFVTGLVCINNGRFLRNAVLCATKKGSNRSLSTIANAEDNMAHVQKSVELKADEILDGLQKKGWVVIDNFLGSNVCSAYRDEAVGYFSRSEMTISKSTKWDPETNSVITYDKHNVYATQLNGGDSYYDGPRLHEYVVSLVKSLVPIISNKFPEACLSPTLASNKLAVCTGDGSSYDKHYDNSGGDDLRKLTVLYYLNPKWRNDLGGSFRIYESVLRSVATPSSLNASDQVESVLESAAVQSAIEMKREIKVTDIDPIGDRLLVFWSDRLVHSVQPSQVGSSHLHSFLIL